VFIAWDACAVCRQATPGGTAAAVPLHSRQNLDNASTAVNQVPYTTGVGYDVYDYELEYRLNRMRQRNSRYITQVHFFLCENKKRILSVSVFPGHRSPVAVLGSMAECWDTSP
jgi:hypothetical protein